jgi:TRAP-type uncharacterized transport system substrate-binding protein
MRVKRLAVLGTLFKSTVARRFLGGLAVVLVALTAAWLGFQYFARPMTLRIAVGLEGGLDWRTMSALGRSLESRRAGIRLQPIVTSGFTKNYQMLEKGEVELAILRGDQGLPAEATVVMILRQNVAVFVAPARHDLDTLTQLKGKRLGLVARSELDEEALAKLLAFHGMLKSDVSVVTIKADQVAAMTDSGRVDAVAVLGPVVDPEIAAVVYAVDRKKKTRPSILAIDLAELADENTVAAKSATIPKNAFARRSAPDDEVDTVSVPTIVAGAGTSGLLRRRIHTQNIEELARNLVERRVELSQKLGIVLAIEAPDNEKGARLPVHPGTAAYLDATDTSWYTLFSDQIWTVWLIGGALFSLCAALFGRMRASDSNPMLGLLQRVQAVTRRARSNPPPGELDALDRSLADLADELSTRAFDGGRTESEFRAVELALDTAHSAVAAARSARTARQSAPEPV